MGFNRTLKQNRQEKALAVDRTLRWQVSHQAASLVEAQTEISRLQQALYAALWLLITRDR